MVADRLRQLADQLQDGCIIATSFEQERKTMRVETLDGWVNTLPTGDFSMQIEFQEINRPNV